MDACILLKSNIASQHPVAGELAHQDRARGIRTPKRAIRPHRRHRSQQPRQRFGTRSFPRTLTPRYKRPLREGKTSSRGHYLFGLDLASRDSRGVIRENGRWRDRSLFYVYFTKEKFF